MVGTGPCGWSKGKAVVLPWQWEQWSLWAAQLLVLDGQSRGLFWGCWFSPPPCAALKETHTTVRGSFFASEGSETSCLWCLLNFETQAVGVEHPASFSLLVWLHFPIKCLSFMVIPKLCL